MTRMVEYDGVYQLHIDPADRVPEWFMTWGRMCRVLSHRDGYVEDDFIRGLVTRQLTVEMPEELHAEIMEASKRSWDEIVAMMDEEEEP